MAGDEPSSGGPSSQGEESTDEPMETGSDDRPSGKASDEFTDPGGQAVAEPSAGRPEVAVDREDASTDEETAEESGSSAEPGVPPDVRKYDRFKKVDGAQYERVNDFLRDRTYITAREWAIARLCSDFRTETGVEMTKIGENLPHLVPFMTDTYTPQAVNQARSSFEEKVRKAG
ncbi:MAG: DUF5806 family protein, partial [Halanaeroarchaeum sp.]